MRITLFQSPPVADVTAPNHQFQLINKLPNEMVDIALKWLDFPERNATAQTCQRLHGLVEEFTCCSGDDTLEFGDPYLNKLRYIAQLTDRMDAVKKKAIWGQLHALGYPSPTIDNDWSRYLAALPKPISRHIPIDHMIHLLGLVALGFCRADVAEKGIILAADLLADLTKAPEVRALAQSVIDITNFSRYSSIAANFSAQAHLMPGIPAAFLELLDQRRMYEVLAPCRARDVAIENTLLRIYQTRSNIPHVRAMAAIQLTTQLLHRRATLITDAMARDLMDQIRQQEGLRESLRTQAGIVLYSLCLDRQDLSSLNLREVSRFAFQCLNKAPDTFDQGFNNIRDVWAKMNLLYLQTSLNRRVMAPLQAKQFAIDLARETRLPSYLRGHYRYLRIFFKYQMFKEDGYNSIRSKDVQALLKLLSGTTQLEQDLDIRLLIVKLYLDGLTEPQDVSRALAWQLADEVRNHSAPGSTRRFEADLLRWRVAP